MRPERTSLSSGRWLAMSLPLLLFLLLPLAALLLRTDAEAAWATLAEPAVRTTIGLSLRTSLLSTALVVVLGTPLAYLLARHAFPMKRALDTLVDLPMVLPPAVAGVALLMAFGRRGLVGTWLAEAGIEVTFTPLAVVMAQAFVAAPLFIRTAAIGFTAVEPELEDAARIDGASEWDIFRHITLPLARDGLVGGGVLAWARALGEFGATIIFAGNLPGRTQTMPLAIYLGFELDLQTALTLSALLLSTSFVTLLVVRRLVLR